MDEHIAFYAYYKECFIGTFWFANDSLSKVVKKRVYIDDEEIHKHVVSSMLAFAKALTGAKAELNPKYLRLYIKEQN